MEKHTSKGRRGPGSWPTDPFQSFMVRQENSRWMGNLANVCLVQRLRGPLATCIIFAEFHCASNSQGHLFPQLRLAHQWINTLKWHHLYLKTILVSPKIARCGCQEQLWHCQKRPAWEEMLFSQVHAGWINHNEKTASKYVGVGMYVHVS